MASTPPEFSALTLPKKRKQTARSDLFYEVPYHPEGKKFDVIPVEFLRNRLTYSIGRLHARINVATNKHHTDRRDAIFANIDDLRIQIGRIIDDVLPIGITNTAELKDVCGKVDVAVKKFKSDRERNLDVGQKVSKIFFQIERDIIGALFDLPRRMASVSPPLPPQHLVPSTDTNDLNDVNMAMEMAIGLRPQLDTFVQTLGKDGETFTANLETLIEFTPLQELVDLLQTPENLEKIPEAVKMACVKEFERYKDALLNVAKFIKSLKEAKTLLEPYTDEELERLKGAGGYFEGLVSFKKRPDLIPGVKALKNLEPKFKKVVSDIKRAKEAIEKIEGDADLITSSPEIKRVAGAILTFAPYANGTNALVLEIFKVEEQVPPVAAASEAESATPTDAEAMAEKGKGADPTTPEVITDEKPATASPLGDEKRALFYWQKATPEQAKEEVRKRILGSPQFTLLAYLFEAERWSDFRIMLEKLTFSDLSHCRISASVLGGEPSVYKTKEDLLKTCFPEAYGEGSEPVVTMARGRSEKRFRWVRQGITMEEIKTEIKSRLFQGWPLIQDLTEQQRWLELRELLDKINTYDLRTL